MDPTIAPATLPKGCNHVNGKFLGRVRIESVSHVQLYTMIRYCVFVLGMFGLALWWAVLGQGPGICLSRDYTSAQWRQWRDDEAATAASNWTAVFLSGPSPCRQPHSPCCFGECQGPFRSCPLLSPEALPNVFLTCSTSGMFVGRTKGRNSRKNNAVLVVDEHDSDLRRGLCQDYRKWTERCF